MAKIKKPAEAVQGRYTALPHALLDCTAFMAASLSCFNGKREADPNCVFVVSATTSPAGASAGTVALVYNAAKSSQVFPVFDLVVYGPVSKAYGIAFHLSYDSTLLRYSGLSLPAAPDPRPFNSDDAPLRVMASTAVDGKIITGIARLAAKTGGLDFPAGANVVGRFNFTAIGEGMTTFSFVAGTLLLANDTIPVADVSSGLWLAGTATSIRVCL